jgi:hypothetical protein
VKPAFLKLPIHDLIWMASEVFAILDDHCQHIYNYVFNFHNQEVGHNYVAYKKYFYTREKMGGVDHFKTTAI